MEVFEVLRKGDLEDKIRATALAEESIARAGYQIKEMAVGDEIKTFLLVNLPKEKVAALLGESVKEVDEKTKALVLAKVKEEEESAVQGFGDIFG